MKRHRTVDLEPIDFGGRYTLIRRLAVGGMAEIYLARQAAMAGFEKEVVIKRLRAELADDPRVVDMFLDEAKIGAQLNHPNIVHVYDVDEHDSIPYIAMEYIIGEELNELCRRGIGLDKFLPLEHAVELMRQAAAGMGYFHARRGADGSALAGEELGIVHLDISPSNLLVTQDGFLKIIDFGIARVKGQKHRVDVLPGKLSYMSPEQAARSGEVDHRSDIFSLGIVLYEIALGRRLFRGPANEVVQRLIDARVEPPTFFRRNFPPALESIIMRALERHPDDRYQSAYDLADDLESFLRDEKLHSGPVRIARYLDLLAIASGGARRPELVSESESKREEELDFDSQLFHSFVPGEGAPGPSQAPLWEDVEQNDAEVAAALRLELAELRALRTPVPTRPSGVVPVVTPAGAKAADAAAAGEHDDGDEDDASEDVNDDPPPTNPVPRMRTAEVFEPDPEPEADEDVVASTGARVAAATAATPAAPPLPLRATSPRAAAARAPVSGPVIGAALLARSPSKLPWVIIAGLALAIAGLVAYILNQ
jgi:serine/threonine protein kinase